VGWPHSWYRPWLDDGCRTVTYRCWRSTKHCWDPRRENDRRCLTSSGCCWHQPPGARINGSPQMTWRHRGIPMTWRCHGDRAYTRTSSCRCSPWSATNAQHQNHGLDYKPDRQWRSSSFQESKKVCVSRDLWPWPWPWAHPGCMLTRRPSSASLVAIRPIVCEKKRFAQKSLQTDRRTGDGRRAIALAHSWNELKTSTNFGKRLSDIGPRLEYKIAMLFFK